MTAVNRRAVSDGYFVFDNGRIRFRSDVNYRAVLNICPRADAYEINIAAHDAVIPNTGVCADFDIADDHRVFSDKCRFINLRRDFTKISDH